MSIAARFGLVLWVGLCLLCLTTSVSAQDDGFASPSESQLQLNEEGSKAFGEGNYEAAAKRFEASLLVGELNITYLNLGRAYFKLGDCKKARQAYAKVRKAPKVRQPPPETILSRLNEYIVELEKVCLEKEEGGEKPPECPEGQVWDGSACVPAEPIEQGQNECPAGQLINADTAGQCCWEGQVWDGDRCIGVPKSCPVGSAPNSKTQGCECTPGKVRDQDGGHCCWAGQVWSSTQNSCVGVVKSCPKGFLSRNGECVDYAANAIELELTLIGAWLRYERLWKANHGFSFSLGFASTFDTDDGAGLFSPAAGSEVSLGADSSGLSMAFGYHWHWAGGLEGGWLGGALGFRKHEVGFFDVSNDEGISSDVEVVDDSATYALISGVAGWRWVWPSGFNLQYRLGAGFYTSSIEIECPDEGFFDEEVCGEVEGVRREAGVWVDTGFSAGWTF